MQVTVHLVIKNLSDLTSYFGGLRWEYIDLISIAVVSHDCKISFKKKIDELPIVYQSMIYELK